MTVVRTLKFGHSRKNLTDDLKQSQGFPEDTDFTLEPSLDPEFASETEQSCTPQQSNDSEQESDKNQHRQRGLGKSSDRKGKRSSKDFEKPQTTYHALEGLKSGAPCHHCAQGRFYKYSPAQFVRISGQAPLQATVHVSERMRCNGCGIYETAKLAPEVLADGAPGQMFAYSARSVIGIHKFLAGHPYHRQETLSEMLCCPVAASTAFEQCENMANDLKPVHDELMKQASIAYHFHIDDTRNHILDAKPELKKNRNGKGESLRTAVYTSAMIATLPEEKTIVLYKTNIGHAGELIDEVLDNRPSGMQAPLVMSDALSWNRPSKTEVLRCLCMVHARREFCDIYDQDPERCSKIIQQMDLLFDIDRQAKEKTYTPEERLTLHREASLPIVQSLQSEFSKALETKEIEKNSPMGKAMGYFLRHYEELTQFCKIPSARLDNNLVEGIIRMVVLGRKNSFFYRTAVGAAIGDIIMSVGVTAQLGRINVFHYFNDLQRNKDQVRKNPAQWLPWMYKKTIEDLRIAPSQLLS